MVVPLVIHPSVCPCRIAGRSCRIAIGPQLLGRATTTRSRSSVLGLGFLLLLAGLEIDVRPLAGTCSRPPPPLRAVVRVSLGVGLRPGAGRPGAFAMARRGHAVGHEPRDRPAHPHRRRSAGDAVGRVVVAGASVAEVVPVVLLSVLFSARGGGLRLRPVALLVAFLAFVAGVGAVIAGVE